MGVIGVIIQAIYHGSTLITGLFIGQKIGVSEDGNIGRIVIIGVLIFIAIVILGFFLYCCPCSQSRSRRRNDDLSQDERELFELMSTTKREHKRKQEN